MTNRKLLYIINVDWYFVMHWLDRANAAKHAGYDVHIAMECSDHKHRQSLEKSGFHVHDIPLCRKSVNPVTELRTVLAIYRLIRQQKPDILHSVTIKPNIYAGVICRRCSIPSVASITGLGTTFSSGQQGLRAFAKRGIKRLYKMAFGGDKSKVLFENTDDLKTMIHSGIIKRKQAVQIYGAGVNTTLFNVSEEPKTHPIRVLFAARLLRNKGLHQLVAAVQQLRKEQLPVELLVAGIIDNDAHGTLPIKELEQWQQQQIIQWLGQVDDMAALINSVNIVCLPTQYGEGVPRILIEGAACGRALIATDVQGCREIILNGKNGLLVTPGNQNELTAALRRLINEPATRKAMGGQGRRLVENKYSASIVIEQTLETYQQSLGFQSSK